MTTLAVAGSPRNSRAPVDIRVDPRDSRAFTIGAAVLVGIVWLSSIGASFVGIKSVATVGLGLLAGLAPIVIDGGALAATANAVSKYYRGESTVFAWTVASAFTVISACANGAHVLMGDHEGSSEAEIWWGTFMAALMPVAAFLTTHMFKDLLVRKVSKSRAELRAEDALRVETLRHDRTRIAEEQRLALEESERQRLHREKEAADLEHFEQIRDSAQAPRPGTAEHRFYIGYVLRAARERRWSIPVTMRDLGLTRNRVDTALSYRGGDLDSTTNERE